jgi:S1-C subfamily serine protease
LTLINLSSSFRPSRRNILASTVVAGCLLGGLSLKSLPLSAAVTNSATAGGDAVAGQQDLLNEQAALIHIAHKVLPAVVHVEAEIARPAASDMGDEIMPFQFGPGGGRRFHRFGPGGGTPAPDSGYGLATGSGVIVDPNGTVITNRHVVENARSVVVVLTDHRRYRGTVYTDPNIDLAVIKINTPEQLPYVRLADSSQVQIGQWAIAIGYPFNVGETLSRGIISALDRSQTIEGQFYPNLMQTDASINPGNSGGALVDINGDLIGINTAIAGAAGQSAGIGFAIPSDTVKAVWPQLAGANHKITNYPQGWVRGRLGVSVGPITPEQATKLGVQDGALVGEVQPDSPAAQAGIQPGDVITRVNGAPILDAEQLVDAVSNAGPGHELTLTIRRNTHNMTITVRTGSFNHNVES